MSIVKQYSKVYTVTTDPVTRFAIREHEVIENAELVVVVRTMTGAICGILRENINEEIPPSVNGTYILTHQFFANKDLALRAMKLLYQQALDDLQQKTERILKEMIELEK